MSEEVELKPCPYCGDGDVSTDKYVLDSEKRGWSAHCHNDRCAIKPYTPMYSTEAEAIAAWNTRPGEEAAYEAGRAAERERIAKRLEQKLGVVQGNEPIVKELYPGEIGSWENALKFAIAIVREEEGG